MLSRERKLRVVVAILRYAADAVVAFVVFVVLRGIIVTATDPVMWPLTAILLVAVALVGWMVWVLVGEMKKEGPQDE